MSVTGNSALKNLRGRSAGPTGIIGMPFTCITAPRDDRSIPYYGIESALNSGITVLRKTRDMDGTGCPGVLRQIDNGTNVEQTVCPRFVIVNMRREH